MLITKLNGHETHKLARVTEGESQRVLVFEDQISEYYALRKKVGLLDYTATGIFRIEGRESIDFLNFLVTKNIEFMEYGQVISALLLSVEGTFVDLVVLYKLEDCVLLETSQSNYEKVKTHLQMYVGRFDAVVIDQSYDLGLIGFEGPNAWKVAQTLLDFEVSTLSFQTFLNFSWEGKSLLLVRTGSTGEYGYKILVPDRLAQGFWDHMLELLRSRFDGIPVGYSGLEMCMTEVRHPNREMSQFDISPIQAGLHWLIDFNKEDFIGRNEVLRQVVEDASERLIGFNADMHVQMKNGADVSVDGQFVGKVIVVQESPILQKLVGLALLRLPFAVPGLVFDVVNGDGGRSEILTVSAPYVVPMSWSIKMI